MNKMELLVGRSTQQRELAWAIAKHFEEGKDIEIRAIGVHCINTACKAVAIANGLLAPKGSRLAMLPSFSTKPDTKGTTDNGEVTVMCLNLHVVR